MQANQKHSSHFEEARIIHDLHHYLPAQGPLKDFIHHNTLHAFQDRPFHQALHEAAEIFGYRSYLSLADYRDMHAKDKVRDDMIDDAIRRIKGKDFEVWKNRMLYGDYSHHHVPRIGLLRYNWKQHCQIDLDSLVHPILFRIVCSYLDQGVSIWHFPVSHRGFLSSMRDLEKNSFASFFRSDRARLLLRNEHTNLTDLLGIVVGDPDLYERYLFDQQFAHQGWSGMVSTIESQPHALLNRKKISLRDFIMLELMLEIDALETHFKGKWKPLNEYIHEHPEPLLGDVAASEYSDVIAMWQEALEWSYYDQVLAGIQQKKSNGVNETATSFQALFCLDDRECSIRRHLEALDPGCRTYGTAGFFGVEFYYQPHKGKFHTKLCPAPVQPQFLIKEKAVNRKREKDPHFTRHSHSLFSGWIISQTLGFWSAFRLFLNIFRPAMGPATASSFRHMDRFSELTIECKDTGKKEDGLQVGFTHDEMADRVEGLLRSIGLINRFCHLIYVVGHGSSSVNNPHYAAYDCGACSGRPGSVNARVLCYMANHPEVRMRLRARGIDIPDTTRFVGGLHDTTRDEVHFFDENKLGHELMPVHEQHVRIFEEALDNNAFERSRRFESIHRDQSPKKIHEQMKLRSVSLFEPRPELNHATNALCIVGSRALTDRLFLDRRSFLNSYDYRVDPDGRYLLGILKAVAPVCGGINLEYYFSRVDNQKLGAGTKLPHNVMGLFGVANGIDGDLRPGLPSQMVEVHDPVRLLVIVEHYPEVLLEVLRASSETYQWFRDAWIHLACVHPSSREILILNGESLEPYQPRPQVIEEIENITLLFSRESDNLPVFILSNH